MALALEWKKDFDTGVEEIDLQHRYFLHLINRVEADFRNLDLSAEAKRRLLMELVKYSEFHFTSEENLMARYGYPEIEQHRLLHTDLLDNLSAMLDSSEQLIPFVHEWFLHHTVEEDGKFGRFFLKGNASGPVA